LEKHEEIDLFTHLFEQNASVQRSTLLRIKQVDRLLGNVLKKSTPLLVNTLKK
jgi:hypothetical protein